MEIESTSENSLKKRYIKGTLWNAFGRYTHQILSIGVVAILSRLLTPEDFGIVAMIKVFTNSMIIFSQAALGPAVVQFQDLNNEDLSSIFWFGIFMGLVMTLLMVAFSRSIAIFYKVRALENVTKIMSLFFLFSTLGVVPLSLLRRHLDFKPINLIRLLSAIISAAAAIFLALWGAGYWALIVQLLLYLLLNNLLYFYAIKWLPSFSFLLSPIKRIFIYSMNITLFSGLTYFTRNMDNLLVGKYWGSSELGYYSHSYDLMLAPLSLITQIITPVLHPALVSIQDNKQRIRSSYIRILKSIAVICFPLMTFMALLAPEIVRTLWGEQWEPCVLVSQILSVVGFIQPLVGASGSVFLACNRTDILLKLGFFNTIIICLGIAIGTPWGIIGVAIGLCIANLIIFLPNMYVIMKVVLGGSLKELLSDLSKPVIITIFIGISLIVWNLIFRGNLPYPLHLFLGGSFAVLVYLIVFRIIDRAFLREFLNLLPQKREP